PLIDNKGRVFAVLAGQLRKANYARAVAAAYDTITAASNAARFPTDMKNHCRGLFAAINVGLSYSKGQSVPSWLHNKEYDGMADELLANPDVIRMAHFASAAFQLWAPRLHAYCLQHDHDLRVRFPNLCHTFANSAFSCAAFNLSPNVWTFRHHDVLNIAFGWCAIQAAGPFHPRKGGHLVLWDLRLVIEFPHRTLIFLPSATIAHSNVPVQPGDKRASFTQFTAREIFH
ncbi:hypothetical protein B0H19DRAFT_969353, partial [Mycena capillaripes]